MNIQKQIQRVRQKNLPPNPVRIQDLTEIPDIYKETLAGEIFLIYDSFSDENYDLTCGRIIVFATRENLKILFERSKTWYLDGTFKVTPGIFFQLFVIMGSLIQVHNNTEQFIALPFVYSLLESKEEVAYAKVLEVTFAAAERFGIRVVRPPKIMTDFELSTINASKNYSNNVKTCFFHLCQNVFRRVQMEGLQGKYNDEDDDSIQMALRMMCALAFIPSTDVPAYFDEIANDFPEEFLPVADYFEVLLV